MKPSPSENKVQEVSNSEAPLEPIPPIIVENKVENESPQEPPAEFQPQVDPEAPPPNVVSESKNRHQRMNKHR